VAERIRRADTGGMRLSKLILGVAAALPTAIASTPDHRVATLYRSSMVFENARLHVATFDAAEPFEYNWENCQLTAALFQQQPGVEVRYWCEKGRYRR
jgi:hypothetical protein